MKFKKDRGLRLKAFFIIGLFISSCSLFQGRDGARAQLARDLAPEKSNELAHHLEYLGQDYLKQIGPSSIVKISKRSLSYLKEMHQRLVKNNELVFPHYTTPHFFIIENKSPFHFSLPGGNYFFSSALVQKYLTNEDLLAAVMAIEIFRSEKSIYEKRSIVPIGSIGSDRMLSLLRLPVETRGEINKWAYLIMRRASYDPGALLNLIQLKNKNALDFSASVGNISSISREEFNYKNFLSRTPVENSEAVVEKNSAKGFYYLRNDLSLRD